MDELRKQILKALGLDGRGVRRLVLDLGTPGDSTVTATVDFVVKEPAGPTVIRQRFELVQIDLDEDPGAPA